MAHTRNTLLEAALRETGWSQAQLAAQLRRVAAESAADELLAVSRSHIAQWLRGVRPSGSAPRILRETLSRGLGRVVTLAEIGLTSPGETSGINLWDLDALTALAEMGETDRDMNRRQVLTTVYAAAGAALPPDQWWEHRRVATRPPLSRLTVTESHVEAMRETAMFFSKRDQRLGGRAGHAALLAYLRTDVNRYLSGRAVNEGVRRDALAAAAELTYLAGWMSFDSCDHGPAQRAFAVAISLAAEADDAPLAGHILRAAAHQAVDLRHPSRALDLATASIGDRRYSRASPREKALLGIVHARALAATDHKTEALRAVRRAEEDLSSADAIGADDEPTRVFFFGEASLAHETACTLRDLGDMTAAEEQFRHSVRTRGAPFARTHAVTLGYLGEMQARRGQVEAACATWGQVLDTLEGSGIQSGRVREMVLAMRRSLSPIRRRGGRTATELDQRARTILRTVG